MAQNNISTLELKHDRQLAKLNLAQTKRQNVTPYGYRELNIYDTSMLPTQYSANPNNLVLIDNPNLGGLVTGRPWHI